MLTNTHNHHGHDHDHDHHHPHGVKGWLMHMLHIGGHSHDHGDLANDDAFLDNEAGIRTVWIALGLLLITAVLQLAIVYASGSVALFADTAHNIGDGLNSIPLLIAFYLARRVATKRYTYGYGRAEDIAGIFIVLSIAVSAGIIFWESFQRFLNPEPLANLGWVAAAAIIGFFGNEGVALLQIRVGRRIGSAALVADGLHARTDGLTSLAVLFAAAGSWLGFPLLDPIIGIGIGVTVLFITRDATKTMWYRLMDAVEPVMVTQAEAIIMRHSAVKAVDKLRMRWVGHQLHAEAAIVVDGTMTTDATHRLNDHLRHHLSEHLPHLSDVTIQVRPA